MNVRTVELADWRAEAAQRFGADSMAWRFVCPICKHVACAQDWKNAGAPDGTIAFSCVGRYLPNPRGAFDGKGAGPCNYAGGGLFRLNPVKVVCPDGTEIRAFEFADALAPGNPEGDK